jgi:type IV pilus assembly protein PilW
MTRRFAIPGRAPRRSRAQSGFTLVEVMVSLALGLVVVGALLTAWMASSQSGRHTDALVQMTEDATLALGVMRQQAAQAGFSAAHGTAGTGPLLHAFPPVLGCAGAGFGDLQAGVLAPVGCASAAGADAPDAIEIAYEASMPGASASNGILGGSTGDQPLDCLGNSFPVTHDGANGDYYLQDSKFYVSGGSLYCHGPGNAAGAAVVQNVETLKVRYGLSLLAGSAQIAYYDAAPAIGSPLWANVVAVSLCVQVRSAARVLADAARPTLGNYVDCAGVRRPSTDGYLHRSFATTIVLQNRLP